MKKHLLFIFILFLTNTYSQSDKKTEREQKKIESKKKKALKKQKKEERISTYINPKKSGFLVLKLEKIDLEIIT